VLGLPSPEMPVRRGLWHLRKQLAVLAALDLDAPRSAGGSLPADRERSSTIVVHVDRAEPSAAGPGAVHAVATQLASLSDGPSAGEGPG
jgi:hypothetical protein